MPHRIDPGELADFLPAGGLTLVSGCSADSTPLGDAVEAAGAALGDMTFCGVFVGGLNRRVWRAGPGSRILTFFQTPELRAEGERRQRSGGDCSDGERTAQTRLLDKHICPAGCG